MPTGFLLPGHCSCSAGWLLRAEGTARGMGVTGHLRGLELRDRPNRHHACGVVADTSIETLTTFGSSPALRVNPSSSAIRIIVMFRLSTSPNTVFSRRLRA